MKIKEYIIENKVKVGATLLGVGVGVGGFIYWATKKEKKEQKDQKQCLAVSQSKASLNSTFQNQDQQQSITQQSYNKKFIKIINQTKAALVKSGDMINPQVITCIIKGQYVLSNQQLKAAILKSREQRRSKLKDTLQYAKIVTKNQLQLELIQQKYLGTILSRFGIDKVTWSQASHEWESSATQQDSGISELIRQQESKLLLSLRKSSSRTRNYKEIEEILKYKIEELEGLDIVELGFDIGTDQASKYDIISSYVDDKIYEKFGIQSEDLEHSIQQLDKAQKQKVIKYEDRVMELMEGFIEADEEQQLDLEEQN